VAISPSCPAVLFLVALIGCFVLPQVAGAEESLRLLRNVDPRIVVVGVGLEACSLLTESLLTRGTCLEPLCRSRGCCGTTSPASASAI
jgi:hypothetical protein